MLIPSRQIAYHDGDGAEEDDASHDVIQRHHRDQRQGDRPFGLELPHDGQCRAGAVARAMPPNKKARYSGISVIQKTSRKARGTTKNMPNDCVSVVMMIERPDFLILFQTSSVPIIRPTAHSRTCTTL